MHRSELDILTFCDMKNISRVFSLFYSFTQTLISFLGRGTCFLFLISPAMFFGCNKKDTVNTTQASERVSSQVIYSKTDHAYHIRTLDALIFEPTGRLECYQRINNPGNLSEIASESGEKYLLLIANSSRERYNLAEIRSLKTASDINIDLESENREYPVLTWLGNINAGEDITPHLQPVRCEIILRSLRCDFTGKPYASKTLTDVKAYLTYVNASCSIILPEQVLPSRIINAGILDKGHLSSFIDETIVVQEIGTDFGKNAVPVNKSFLCFANQPEEESIGSPFTRLVIEGKIDNDTYYYPIKINDGNGGLNKGSRYILDITITRTGATHPDGSLEECDIQINTEVETWEEKKDITIGF